MNQMSIPRVLASGSFNPGPMCSTRSCTNPIFFALSALIFFPVETTRKRPYCLLLICITKKSMPIKIMTDLFAIIYSPCSIMGSASVKGTNLGNLCVPPPPGSSPSMTSGNANVVFLSLTASLY